MSIDVSRMKVLSLMFILSFPWSTTDKEQTVSHKFAFQKGMASWYGKENRRSSTGKILKHKTPALAHKTLPIGTVVKVTSLRTKRTVKAVVEDRGPYTKGRIVDLNYPAAKELGILKDGITKVQVEVVR